MAGFVLLSVIAHALFLAVDLDFASKHANVVQLAPPLQVMVVTSRENAKTVSNRLEPAVSSNTPGSEIIQRPRDQRRIVTARPVAAAPQSADQASVVPSRTTTGTKPDMSKHPASGPQHAAQEKTEHVVQKVKAVQATSVPVNHLLAKLRSQLAQHFTYPRLARRMGWEGQVSLGMHIDADGSLDRIHVVRSSGYRVLDENALTTLDRIGQITVASNQVIHPVDTEIDVLYRLTD